MIRKISDSYMLDSATASANFGGWDVGVHRVRASAANHGKAMRLFKRASPEMPLNPAQNRRSHAALSWDGGDPA